MDERRVSACACRALFFAGEPPVGRLGRPPAPGRPGPNLKSAVQWLRLGRRCGRWPRAAAPFADVREWETRKERAGQFVGVGVRGSLAAVGASAQAEREAKANSGLFVTVKDIESPKWRIAMKDEVIQARWMEILRQEVNES